MGLALKIFLLFLALCALLTLIWLCLDFRRYIKRHSWVFLLLVSMDVCAQYVDREGCTVSFCWHENTPGQLEMEDDGVLYRFLPSGKSWNIQLRNLTDKEVYVKWSGAHFMLNAVTSMLAFYGRPYSEEPLPQTCLKAGEEQTFEVTSQALVEEKKTRRIYTASQFKKVRQLSVHIMLPISYNGLRYFYKEFSFLVTRTMD